MNRLLRLRLGWVPGAVLALALFATGAAAHFAHHLAEPGCDDGGPSSHPCVACSVLHGGALAEDAQTPITSEPSRSAEHVREVTDAPLVAEPGPSAPRAPPLA